MQGMDQAAQIKDDKQIRSVFVGNIPYEANEDELKGIFSKIGPVVSFRIVYDRESGKPKGYGFCEFRDTETAQSAIRNLNGLELHNRTLRVDSAVNEKGKEDKEVKPPEIPSCGPSVPVESASENIAKLMSSMSPEQVFELLKQMKACIQDNPDESRDMLIKNPQLGFALLQALILLKIVDPKMVDGLLLKSPIVEPVPPVPNVHQYAHEPLPPRDPPQPQRRQFPPEFHPTLQPKAEKQPDHYVQAHQKSPRYDSRVSIPPEYPHPPSMPPNFDDYYDNQGRDYTSRGQPPLSVPYQYADRERSHRNRPSTHRDYPRDQGQYYRRERNQPSPRDHYPYDDREPRHQQDLHVNPNVDPRIQILKNPYDDHHSDRRDYLPSHSPVQPHPEPMRYRQSRYH